MIVTVAALVLGFTAALQIYFRLKFFRHVGRMHTDPEAGILHRAQVPELATIPVSVVICAHNEASNLARYLPSVLRQRYHYPRGHEAFEVIVVNDASTDESAGVLAGLQNEFPILRVVTIGADENREFPGKKFALSKGIAAAMHEVIVCTDADCEPATDVWLHCMATPFLKGKSIVAGYGGYREHPGWLNRFIRYETMQTFFLYYSFWKGGAPYMAVGRNMAALKSIYLRAATFPVWSALPSGDDDLLIQLCATRDNMSVVTFPGSFTWSEPKRTVAEYISQKRRHVSTGKFYNRKSKILLAAYSAMILSWLPMPIVACSILISFVFDDQTQDWILRMIVSPPRPVAIAIIVVAMALFGRLLRGNEFSRYSGYLRERTTVVGWLLFSFCWLLYNAVLAPWILWKTKQRWK